MASLEKMKSGWRVHIARRGYRTSKVFRTKAEAEAWAKTEGCRFREQADQLPRLPRGRTAFSTHLSEAEIVAKATQHVPRSGVYFLIEGGIVVYVGQSIDVVARIARHVGLKIFDSYYIIDCPPDQLRALEDIYIKRLNPPLNAAGRLRVPEQEAADGVTY